MPKKPNEINYQLYCPECASQGMRPLNYKSESGRTRYRCPECKFRTTSTVYTRPQILPKPKIGEIRKHKRFLITSAVNDTELVKGAHETFINLAKIEDACYLVIPGVYKNPDLKHQGVINQYTWPEEIVPYLCNADVKLNDSLMVRGETRIQYTAINPLCGMNHAGDIRSEIYGHPQVAMEPVATSQNSLPKILHTTGSISQKNYGGSKRARKASFHHSIGALFVEIEGDKFWTTQVLYDGEGAYLYDNYYTPKKKIKSGGVEALIYGDTHVYTLPKKTEQQLEKLTKLINPTIQIFHDLHDQHIGSHHTRDNTLHNIGKCIRGELSVRDELMMSVKFLNNKRNPYVIDSNHHRHLDQWFNRFKPNGGDHINLDLYYELASMAADDIRNGGDANLFRLFIEKYCDKEVQFVSANDPFFVCGIDCSQHGDRGPGGSRGSANGFAKTGHKTFIGHSHAARISKGCWQVGVSHPEADYAMGYTNWSSTHGVIYENGKRGFIMLVDNKLSPMMRKKVS